MDERKMEFRTGLAVVIGLIILAALVIFAGGLNFLRDYYNIKAVFKTAGGIKRGAPVRMAGVEIGRVKSISIETEPDMTSFISMTVEIERGYKIPTDSRIAITSDSLLGERLLEITPGTTSAHLQPGETLSKMGTTPGTLEDALKEVPGIVEKLSLTVESINKIVSDPKVQNDFRRAIEKIADSAANAEGLIKDARSVIAENRDNVNSAIQNFADTSAQAKEFIGKLQGIETEIADTIKSLDKELRTFTKRINDPEIFEKITNALDKFEQLPEQMTKLVKTLQEPQRRRHREGA
ncbi:MAG: MlaD family protein [Planctomycetota bacterium]|nr:MlaD family protein [Planctomycetota bacterium]